MDGTEKIPLLVNGTQQFVSAEEFASYVSMLVSPPSVSGKSISSLPPDTSVDGTEKVLTTEGKSISVSQISAWALGRISSGTDATYEIATTHAQLLGLEDDGCHPVSAITGLQDTLDGKSAAIHNHDTDYDTIGSAANVQSALDGHAGATNPHAITTAMLGLDNVDNTADADKPVSVAQQSEFDSLEGRITTLEADSSTAVAAALSSHTSASNPHGITASTIDLGNVDNTSDMSKPVSTAQQSALDAKADLVGGIIPANQLPAYVDDVLEYDTYASFPAVGEAGKIYIDTSTNLQYRWGGSDYAGMSSSLALGETSATAYRGDRGATAYAHSQIVSGNPHGITLAGIGAAASGHGHAASSTVASGFLPQLPGDSTKLFDGSGNWSDIPNTTALEAQIAAMNKAISYDNVILNGEFAVDQDGLGETNNPTSSIYITDGWRFVGNNVAAAYSVEVNKDSLICPGFESNIGFEVISQQTVSATDFYSVFQYIEGNRLSKLQWGTSDAKDGMLTFWVCSTLTGTFSASLHDLPSTQSFIVEFEITAANTWTSVAIPIPATTSGAWHTNGTAIGAAFHIDTGSGSNFIGTANDWISGTLHTTAASDKFIEQVAGSKLYITGIQLYPIDDVANPVIRPYQHKSYDEELRECQRYYRILGTGMTGVGAGTNACVFSKSFEEQMRAAPALSLVTTSPVVNVLGISVITGSSSAITAIASTKNGVALVTINGFSAGVDGALLSVDSEQLFYANARL